MKGGLRLPALVIFFTIICVVTVFSLLFLNARKNAPIYGATFSIIYANELNIDWKKAYIATLDDLQIQALRIPVYWSKIESDKDAYYFDDLDWIMNEAAGRNVPVTLVIGQKVPRWPECFIPDWAEYSSNEERSNQLLQFMKITVERYKNHPALHRWQVENEAYFPFGECPSPDYKLVNEEIDLVRKHDPEHDIQITTSGEQAFWAIRAIKADLLGVSLYRVVQDKFFGVFIFPYKPEYYALQRLLASPFTNKVIISELQVEPWGINDTRIGENQSVEAAYKLFTEEDVEFHMDYARQTGIDEVYLWGIEWWYYLKQNDEPRLWNAGKNIIENSLWQE